MNFDIKVVTENICRVCLCKDPVFEISNEVSEKLKLCGGIDNEIGNKTYPSKICHKCFINLEISYEFRKICQQSDKKLKQSLRNPLIELEKHEDKLENLKVEFLEPKEEPIEISNEQNINNSPVAFNLNFDDTIADEFIQNIREDLEELKESKCDSLTFYLANENQKEELKNPENNSKVKSKSKDTKRFKDKKIEKIKNSENALHACEFCGIRYVSKFSMENHMRLHSARLRYVCEICGDSYAGKFQLRQHMCAKHTGERNFKCGNCDKAFFSKTLRNKHQKRSHSKIFKCDQCDKSFGRSDSLKKHMRVHTGEKPIVCDKCGTRFKELHHLKNHNKSMTPCILKMSIKVKDG